MDLPIILTSQYLAALEMLKQTITQCPESLWNDPADKTKFWHIAYHALFFTHLYLQESGQTFTPWSKHHPDYESLGPSPLLQIGEPYDKENVLEYLTFCQEQVVEQVPHLDLEGASGFDWLPFGKLELQLYNMRHLQQHTGELMERLGRQEGIELRWVGAKPDGAQAG